MLKKATKRQKKSVINFESSPPALGKIRERAYNIWEAKGRPENSALDNWLEAERGLSKS